MFPPTNSNSYGLGNFIFEDANVIYQKIASANKKIDLHSNYFGINDSIKSFEMIFEK